MFIQNSDLIGHPVFLFAKAGSPRFHRKAFGSGTQGPPNMAPDLLPFQAPFPFHSHSRLCSSLTRLQAAPHIQSTLHHPDICKLGCLRPELFTLSPHLETLPIFQSPSRIFFPALLLWAATRITITFYYNFACLPSPEHLPQCLAHNMQ